MSFQMRPTNDLIRIASAGGGFTLDADVRPTEDLIRIASAASAAGARVHFRGLSLRPTDDLIRIGSAGRGVVSFEG